VPIRCPHCGLEILNLAVHLAETHPDQPQGETDAERKPGARRGRQAAVAAEIARREAKPPAKGGGACAAASGRGVPSRRRVAQAGGIPKTTPSVEHGFRYVRWTPRPNPIRLRLPKHGTSAPLVTAMA